MDVLISFMNLEKAFDKVKHNKLKRLFKGAGVDDKYIQIITNLYCNQTAKVKIILPNDISIQRGVRQGFILLFNLYLDKLFKKAL